MLPKHRAHALLRAARRLCVALALLCISGLADAQTKTLILPTAVAYDVAGDLFFADAARNQVFEVSLAGAMSVVAGTGEQGFGGDGASATSSQLNQPQGVAVGSDGTLYIADTGNDRIRAVSGGVIRTFAGTGVRGSGGDGGAATAARFSKPGALAVDATGALLVCDTGNHRVRRISAGVVATIAGTGVQGFAGDGGSATTAELDSPAGVAVMPDGRVVIADSHNHRLRVLGTDGVIQTLAGSGNKGYTGDGGPATAAQLFLPRGVSVTASSDVLFADSDNHRIRKIDAQGIITTIAGDGWQGNAVDGTTASAASLNTPRGVVVPVYGAATVADAPNGFVREIAADGRLYIVAAPLTRATAISVSVPKSLAYGQGSATVLVVGKAATPQGAVTLLDGTTQIANGVLSGGAMSVPLLSLKAGMHSLSASYAGDGLNPAAVSATVAVTVQVANVVATANAASMVYGQAIPQLSGTETGILPQDANSVVVNFSTAAILLSPVGSYPITAQLSGPASGNYTVTMAASSGALTITQAQSTVQMQSLAQTTYAGLPITLNAGLGSVTSGVPTGEVDFMDNGALVAKAIAVNGGASAAYLSAASGAHSFTAVYAGDHNFLGSTSAAVAVTVGAMPDFNMSASPATQSVQAGLIANYSLTFAPVGGPFTGSVSLNISGLPKGAQASFSPSIVVPGASGTSVTLAVQTPTSFAGSRMGARSLLWCAWMPGLLLLSRRKNIRSLRNLAACFGLYALMVCAGCGARTVDPATSSTPTTHSFPLMVTATSTNLAGAIVTHTAALTLNVQ